MNKSRLEAFSDGVIAIIITIMVLELKVPHGGDWNSLKPLLPTFASYIMSFLFIGIYWGNHHHLLHTVKKINASMMLANLHLLFWLSLVPFATAWMGENHFVPFTVACYAVLLLICGIAFTILQRIIYNTMDEHHPVKTAMQALNRKGYYSVAGYTLAIPLAYVNPVISGLLFITVSILWLIPDKKIEKALSEHQHN